MMAYATWTQYNCMFDIVPYNCNLPGFCRAVLNARMRMVGLGSFSDGLALVALRCPAGWDAADVLDYLAPYGCMEVHIADYRLSMHPIYPQTDRLVVEWLKKPV